MKSETQSIAEWVKANSSVSTVAAELNLSRPTVYKYMEKYDSGEKDKIPESVRDYFDIKLSSEDDPKFIERRLNLLDETMVLQQKLKVQTHQMEDLLEEKKMLEIKLKEMTDPELMHSEQEIAKIREVRLNLDIVSKKSMECGQEINDLRRRLDDTEHELSVLERTKYVPFSTKQIFKIRSSCFVENGKCMVVHTGDRTMSMYVEDRYDHEELIYYRLHLYAKIDNEYAHLGDYRPVKGRNFFIIDDVFLSAPLYYNIVAYVADPGIDDEEREITRPDGEPDLIELSSSESTGMCELKQRK